MSAPDYEVPAPAGRVVLARWRRLVDVAHAEAYRAAIFSAVGAVDGPVVVCADWRFADIVAPEVTPVITSMLVGVAHRIERSAIALAKQHATFNLQAERVVREAGNPARRTFRDTEQMLAWVGEVTTPQEHVAMRAFLAAG
jgi:hypothetical protein